MQRSIASIQGTKEEKNVTLIFLVKEEGERGICAEAYLKHMLDAAVFPYYD